MKKENKRFLDGVVDVLEREGISLTSGNIKNHVDRSVGGIVADHRTFFKVDKSKYPVLDRQWNFFSHVKDNAFNYDNFYIFSFKEFEYYFDDLLCGYTYSYQNDYIVDNVNIHKIVERVLRDVKGGEYHKYYEIIKKEIEMLQEDIQSQIKNTRDWHFSINSDINKYIQMRNRKIQRKRIKNRMMGKHLDDYSRYIRRLVWGAVLTALGVIVFLAVLLYLLATFL